MTTAKERGWGDPGAPGSEQERAYRREHIVSLRAGGVDWLVRREVADLFRHLIENVIVPTIGEITVRADDWSFANRCVRGTGPGTGKPCVKSNHSWGLAIDVNATQNVRGVADRDGQFPATFGQRVDDYGFRWGGDFTSTADPMHFEFVGTPADAARFSAALDQGGNVPVDDMKNAVRAVLNEGTAAGYKTWKDTSKGVVAKINALANKANEVLAAVRGVGADVVAVREAIDAIAADLRARPGAVAGFTLEEIAVAVADENARRVQA